MKINALDWPTAIILLQSLSFILPLRLSLFDEAFDSLLSVVQLQVVSHGFSASCIGGIQVHAKLLVVKVFPERHNRTRLAFDCIANFR